MDRMMASETPRIARSTLPTSTGNSALCSKIWDCHRFDHSSHGDFDWASKKNPGSQPEPQLQSQRKVYQSSAVKVTAVPVVQRGFSLCDSP